MDFDANCPWTPGTSTYPQCQGHHYPPSTAQKGVGSGQNQGQCNVPTSQVKASDWAFESVRFGLGNKHRYDYAAILTEGSEMVFEYRDAT